MQSRLMPQQAKGPGQVTHPLALAMPMMLARGGHGGRVQRVPQSSSSVSDDEYEEEGETEVMESSANAEKEQKKGNTAKP